MQNFTEILSTKIPQWMGSSTSIIIHTILFAGIFLLQFVGLNLEQIMLILTTIVSLEAIYLSLFIQMTVNKHSTNLQNVGQDITEIQQKVVGMQQNENLNQISIDIQKLLNDIKQIKK